MGVVVTIDEPPGAMDVSGRAPVQSLSRGLGIIGQLTGDGKGLSLTELSRRTGLHRATVYRFVKTLEVEGYLTYDAESGLYSIGPAWAMALYSLGSGTVFAEVLRTDLRALAESSLETVTLGLRQGDNVRVVHASPSSRGFVPKLPESRLHPLHATWNVQSQVLLAFSGEETKRRMLAVQPTRFTEHTVVDPEAVRERLERVLKEGVAYDREEFHIGTCAVAVPIMSSGKVAAALGLVVPVERFTDDSLPSFIDQLRAAANPIGKRLAARER
jgi:DNA-binding IclR family transcriptional regulator